MDQNQVRELLQKYQSGRCTPDEKAWVEKWYAQRLAQSVLPDDEIDLNEQKKKSLRRIQAAVKPGRQFPIPARCLRNMDLNEINAN